MNAVIALCHFCEAHGPCAIFCTQTLRDTKIENEQVQASCDLQINKFCSACNSLKKNCIYSKDEESEATFLSSQTPVITEVSDLIKQASIRSLSCEINCSKDGGFVFFGDSIRGHVLSHSFHVSDLQARGFFQLFSIIVLMKDKYFLLNLKPFLAEHLKKISTEIQNSAHKIKESEETKRYMKRGLSSSQVLVQTPRSLVDLTGEENIFAILHSHFSWILLAGSRYFTEHVAFDNFPWLTNENDHCEIKGQSQFLDQDSTSIDTLEQENASDNEELFCLRYAKEMLGIKFTDTCYCVLVGIKIVVRGCHASVTNLLMCLKNLLPEEMRHLISFDTQSCAEAANFKILSLLPSTAFPEANSLISCVDINDSNEFSVIWKGELPTKWPDLLTKIVKAVDDPRFANLALSKHTRVLVEEWKNKIICIQRAKSNNGLHKLEKVLGIQPHDQPVVSYWMNYLK